MSRFFILILLLVLASCSTTFKNQDIIGKSFPSVKGKSLADKFWSIPKDFEGSKVLLLIGYKQDSQFDIDRWLIGIDMKKINVKVYELPTIQGMFPRMFKTRINSGMKKGIPKSIWGAVITIYKDGEKVQQFTGNERANNARVILLDKKGKIRYFYSEGFSVPALNKLQNTLKSM
jgi:hypothetical protein